MAAAQRKAPDPARSFRERVGALGNLLPFLKQIWATSPALTTASLGLRVMRAFLPIMTLYVGKLIIDEAVRLVGLNLELTRIGEWYRSGELTVLIWLLGLEFVLAVLSDVLGRVVALIDALLSERFNNDASVRLMEHAATLDLEDFEDSEVQDMLDRARRLTMGRMTPINQLFGLAQSVLTILTFAAGLVVYAPWLIVLLAIALVPAFLGEVYFNSLNYSLNFAWTPERRELEYARQTAVGIEAAKEIKIFGISRFLIDRYRALATAFHLANRKLAISRAAWGSALTALGTLSYYAAYAYIAWRTVQRRVHHR